MKKAFDTSPGLAARAGPALVGDAGGRRPRSPRRRTPQVKPNRRPPSVKPVPQTPVFSAWPNGRGDLPRPRLRRAARADRRHDARGERSARPRADGLPAHGAAASGHEDLDGLPRRPAGEPVAGLAPAQPGHASIGAPATSRARCVAWEEAWGIAKSATDSAWARRGRSRGGRAGAAPRAARQPGEARAALRARSRAATSAARPAS